MGVKFIIGVMTGDLEVDCYLFKLVFSNLKKSVLIVLPDVYGNTPPEVS